MIEILKLLTIDLGKKELLLLEEIEDSESINVKNSLLFNHLSLEERDDLLKALGFRKKEIQLEDGDVETRYLVYSWQNPRMEQDHLLTTEVSTESILDGLRRSGSQTKIPAINLVKKAASRKAYIWRREYLSSKEIAQVFLPWHKHSKGELVPQNGSTVEEASMHLLEKEEHFLTVTPECARSIFFFRDAYRKLYNEGKKKSQLFEPIVLSEGKLKNTGYWDGYTSLPDQEGALYHVDGLHRAMGWYLASLEFPDKKLPVYISRPDHQQATLVAEETEKGRIKFSTEEHTGGGAEKNDDDAILTLSRYTMKEGPRILVTVGAYGGDGDTMAAVKIVKLLKKYNFPNVALASDQNDELKGSTLAKILPADVVLLTTKEEIHAWRPELIISAPGRQILFLPKFQEMNSYLKHFLSIEEMSVDDNPVRASVERDGITKHYMQMGFREDESGGFMPDKEELESLSIEEFLESLHLNSAIEEEVISMIKSGAYYFGYASKIKEEQAATPDSIYDPTTVYNQFMNIQILKEAEMEESRREKPRDLVFIFPNPLKPVLMPEEDDKNTIYLGTHIEEMIKRDGSDLYERVGRKLVDSVWHYDLDQAKSFVREFSSKEGDEEGLFRVHILYGRFTPREMLTLYCKTGHPYALATGDQSFLESIACRKLPYYFLLGHKVDLYRNYLEALDFSEVYFLAPHFLIANKFAYHKKNRFLYKAFLSEDSSALLLGGRKITDQNPRDQYPNVLERYVETFKKVEEKAPAIRKALSTLYKKYSIEEKLIGRVKELLERH